MRKTSKPSSASRLKVAGMEPICVTAFRDLSFLFPNDLFVLASWIAMSDLATSTPSGRKYTTIHGLTRKFQDLTGVAAEQVSDYLAAHGIERNCNLVLPEDVDECGGAADGMEFNRAEDRATEDLYHGRETKRVRRIPANIREAALRKLDVLNVVNHDS